MGKWFPRVPTDKWEPNMYYMTYVKDTEREIDKLIDELEKSGDIVRSKRPVGADTRTFAHWEVKVKRRK